MEFRRELVGATTTTLILSVLQREPGHGYEIVRRVNEMSDGVFRWREGTIYPALHRLEKEGWIEGRWRKISPAKKRRVYSITDDGARALKLRTKEWEVYSVAIGKILDAAPA